MQEEEQTRAALDQTKGRAEGCPGPLRSLGGDAGHLRRGHGWSFLQRFPFNMHQVASCLRFFINAANLVIVALG